MIALTKPSLLPMYLDKDYLGLAKVLRRNAFLSELGVLPQIPQDTSADVKVLTYLKIILFSCLLFDSNTDRSLVSDL